MASPRHAPGTVEHLSTEEELKALTAKLDILGFYHKIMDEDEFRPCSRPKRGSAFP